ncbi:hypothetical protein TDB9533_01802 [Thalassocella blandensis]|nr:hypothetical protein TDB9533_01802 [Thalassocella blandensis]
MIELCRTTDLPEGSSKSFSLPSGNIFLVKKQQQIYAYRNSCPHLGIPLEWVTNKFLDEDGELIQCATHGALFTIEDGMCVYGPCVNQSLTRVSVQEIQGSIYFISP